MGLKKLSSAYAKKVENTIDMTKVILDKSDIKIAHKRY